MLTRRIPEQRPARYLSPWEWFFGSSDGDGTGNGDLHPSMDVRETGDGYRIDVELPGIKADDIEVTIDGRTLTIRGHTASQDGDGDDGRFLVRERRSASYSRSVTLPTELDAEHTTCSFENGELRVTIPRAANAGSRRIPVSGATAARQVGPVSKDEGKGSEAQGAKTNDGS